MPQPPRANFSDDVHPWGNCWIKGAWTTTSFSNPVAGWAGGCSSLPRSFYRSRLQFRGRFHGVFHFTPKCNRVFAARSRPQNRGHYAAPNLELQVTPKRGSCCASLASPWQRAASAHKSRVVALQSGCGSEARYGLIFPAAPSRRRPEPLRCRWKAPFPKISASSSHGRALA